MRLRYPKYMPRPAQATRVGWILWVQGIVSWVPSDKKRLSPDNIMSLAPVFRGFMLPIIEHEPVFGMRREGPPCAYDYPKWGMHADGANMGIVDIFCERTEPDVRPDQWPRSMLLERLCEAECISLD